MSKEFDKCPCNDKCPIEEAMDLIGGKWKFKIICSLHSDGATRYNELKRKLKGISNTMLASTLKELEKEGLVRRKQYMEMPIRVEYTATEVCEELVPIIEQLAKWAMK